MRYIPMLALFLTCVSAASAADDPVTKRNNDASTPVLIKSRYLPPAPRSVVKPNPGDSRPTK